MGSPIPTLLNTWSLPVVEAVARGEVLVKVVAVEAQGGTDRPAQQSALQRDIQLLLGAAVRAELIL